MKTLLIVGLMVLMVLGTPVAFSLMGISSLLLALYFGPNQLFIMVGSYLNQVQSEVLLAIPMFVLMANFLQMSGIGSDIYNTMHKWLGGVRGGLAIATIGATAIIAAMSGVAATGTIAMGVIALPEMLKRRYDKSIAIGPILAGGALGPIIPPSTIMIIVAAYSGISTGKLFLGGIIPGLIFVLLFSIYISIRCWINPDLGPNVPKEERASWSEKMKSLYNVIAPLAIIIIVLGVIYSGIATPTEAAGIGAFSAFVYTLVKRKLSFGGLKRALLQTTKVSTMLLWIMMGGAAYSSLVNITRMGDAIARFMTMVHLGPQALLFAIIAIAFILGMFIEGTAIIMIAVPIVMPLIQATGLDLYTTMLLLSITICLGMITPPFGVNIFYLKGVTPPEITLNDMYKASMPFTLIMLISILIFALFPSIISTIPNMMFP